MWRDVDNGIKRKEKCHFEEPFTDVVDRTEGMESKREVR